MGGLDARGQNVVWEERRHQTIRWDLRIRFTLTPQCAKKAGISDEENQRTFTDMERRIITLRTPTEAESLDTEDRAFLDDIRATLLREPAVSFTSVGIGKRLGIPTERAKRCLDYLGDLAREFEAEPRHRGVAKVLIRGKHYYQALSDNPDVRRDYDYRATNEGGRDFCPKNMFYYVWAWINMVERKCQENAIPNNQTVLITNDCRYYPPEIIEAAKRSAMLRGYQVVYAFADGTAPSCVSSYSHAVRMARPVLAIFITASHVSRPAENTVVGAKVSMLGTSGQLESLSTKDIKIVSAEEIQSLKDANDLHRLIHSARAYEKIDVSESHTRMAVAAVLAVLGRFPGTSLHDLAQQLKIAPRIDLLLQGVMPAEIPALFHGLRIVVEGAHTSSGPLAQRAFQALGAQTTLLHGEVQAVHGPHSADPSITKNLHRLFGEMKKHDAHLGMAFDLDGDRGAIILPNGEGEFVNLAPDKLGQVLLPFLMGEGGYHKAPKPMHIRDCLSTDAVTDQGKLSGVTIETTDAGYVFLKQRENQKAKEGFLTMSMGEASGHAWLDFTGPFENPIVLTLLFTAMGVKHLESKQYRTADGSIPAAAMNRFFNDWAIPYRKSTRFQPLFAPELIAEAAKDPANDTGWSSDSRSPIPQKIIGLCRSASVKKLMGFFTEGKTFGTPLGKLKVDRFETQWDDEAGIYRFGKIYFLLNDVPVGSFVSRGSSNDPTAVQVWEVKEFDGATWNGVKLPEEVIQQRFDLIGGFVLTQCADLGILELVDRKPAANMAEVLSSVERYREMMVRTERSEGPFGQPR